MEPRNPAADDEDDTARLPALSDTGDVPDPDRVSSTDSWAIPEALRAEPGETERANAETVISSVVELGALRRNLASMAENRGQLENSLHSLTANLREVEAQLVIKTGRIAEVEERERALQAELAVLQQQAREQQQLLQSAQSRRDHCENLLDERERQVGELQDRIAALQPEIAEARQALAAAVEEKRAAVERSSAAETALQQREQQLQKQLEIETGLRTEVQRLRDALAERDALIARVEGEAASGAAVLGNIRSSLERAGAASGEPPALEPVARLLVRQDDGKEEVHVLGRRTLVGRGLECQLRIDAEYVSRRHALIQVSAAATVVEDLGSTNGVFVNGTRVKHRVLAEGDEVMIGKTRFHYRLKAPAAAD